MDLVSSTDVLSPRDLFSKGASVFVSMSSVITFTAKVKLSFWQTARLFFNFY